MSARRVNQTVKTVSTALNTYLLDLAAFLPFVLPGRLFLCLILKPHLISLPALRVRRGARRCWCCGAVNSVSGTGRFGSSHAVRNDKGRRICVAVRWFAASHTLNGGFVDLAEYVSLNNLRVWELLTTQVRSDGVMSTLERTLTLHSRQ